MGLPCLAGKCAAGCEGPQPDPWDGRLMWPECPGKATYKRADIRAALEVRGAAALSPLSDWPRGYAAHVLETWTGIQLERQALDEVQHG